MLHEVFVTVFLNFSNDVSINNILNTHALLVTCLNFPKVLFETFLGTYFLRTSARSGNFSFYRVVTIFEENAPGPL